MSELSWDKWLLHRANLVAVREAWEQHGQRDEDEIHSGRRLSATLLTVARAAGCSAGDVDTFWVNRAMMLLVAHVSTATYALLDRPLLADEAELLHELTTLADLLPWLEWAADRLNEQLAVADA